MDKVTAEVLFDGKHAGELARGEEGYAFRYADDYLRSQDACPISNTLPLSTKTYTAKKLFPFFESLLSEGWLLEVQSRTQKIDENDYFTLLIENGQDLVGAVSVVKRS
jgi:serine/threonine-protein kinase HipA